MRQTDLLQYWAKKRDYDIKREDEFKRKLKVRQDKNNDTTIRMDIHAEIKKGIESGKSKIEIIESLQEERFLKYKDFFESWIDDKLNKMNKPNKQISKEER